MAYWYDDTKTCKYCGDDVYEIGETYYCQTCMRYLTASDMNESKNSALDEWDAYIRDSQADLDALYGIEKEEEIEVITVDKTTLPMHGMFVVMTEMEENDLKAKVETCLGAKVNYIGEPLNPLFAQFFEETEGKLIASQLGLSRNALEYRIDITIPTFSLEDREKAILAMREISPAFVFREDCSKVIITSNKGIGGYIAKDVTESKLLSLLLTIEAKAQLMRLSAEAEMHKDTKKKDVYLSVENTKGILVELETLEDWKGMSPKLKEHIDDCEDTCITISASDSGSTYTIEELIENTVGTLGELEEIEELKVVSLKMEVSANV